MASDTKISDLGFDPVELREKYRIERDKRIHPDGAHQHVGVSGDFSHTTDVEGLDRPIRLTEVVDFENALSKR